jgi:hypothetical protein
VAPVYAGIGVLEMIIPLCFAFTPLGHAERYLPVPDQDARGAVAAPEQEPQPAGQSA